MSIHEDEFFQRLLATFRGEAVEHLQAIADGLLTLEQGTSSSDRTQIIETIYREAHSLKGAARAVNLREIETLCQPLESLLASWKRQANPPTAAGLDLVQQAITVLEKLVNQAEKGLSAGLCNEAQEMTKRLNQALLIGEEPPLAAKEEPPQKGPEPPAPPPPSAPEPQVTTAPEAPQAPPPQQPQQPVTPAVPRPLPDLPSHTVADKPVMAETIRVAAAKLDALLLEAEEFIAAKLIAGQRAAELRETVLEFETWQKQWAKVQPRLRELKRLASGDGNGNLQATWGRVASQLTEFLEWNAELIKRLEHKLTPMMRAAQQDTRVIGGLVDNLLDDVKKILMLPFSMLLETFPRFVRDLAREQGKKIDFTIRGREVEIDRRILQEIKDPLMHLVRNSIDHGLEPPEMRVRHGKAEQGQLSITIAQRDSGKVEICVADDGCGINPERVKAAAVKHGLLTQAEADALSPEDAQQLIFRSGVSTSPIITTISGRGLGLAIVQEKVEKLGGTLHVESVQGQGTVFRLILPLTLATFRGTLIKVSDRLFVIPTTHLERVVRVKVDEIKTVDRRETILLNGQPLALVSLADILGLPPQDTGQGQGSFLTVLVLNVSGQRLGFHVAAVINEQEVLVKNLGSQLLRVPNIAGATVLGSGVVVPILNVSDLVKSAIKRTASLKMALPPAPTKAEQQVKSILVAEDSITARTLLKNILELAGYRVQTAVDGVEGFSALQEEHFDLVVSDVEMPRMNGFELTARIRADKRLADLPVVLVTALESPEDRKKGIEVGANAYLVKSSFDQGNLLTIIQQLI